MRLVSVSLIVLFFGALVGYQHKSLDTAQNHMEHDRKYLLQDIRVLQHKNDHLDTALKSMHYQRIERGLRFGQTLAEREAAISDLSQSLTNLETSCRVLRKQLAQKDIKIEDLRQGYSHLVEKINQIQ